MVKIFSLNCKGLRNTTKIELLAKRFQEYKVDICFLQETHILFQSDLSRFIEQKCKGKIYWSSCDTKSKGVGIYISDLFSCTVDKFYADLDGRLVYVDAQFDNREFRLINVYAPNNIKDRKDFFHSLYRFCVTSRPLILGGDFNCVTNLKLDKKGGNNLFGNGGKEELLGVLKDFCLVDVFRKKFPDKREYTWRGNNIRCRLDRFYVTSTIFQSLEDVRHILCPFSDHTFVSINLSSFSHIQTGKPYWKLNNSLLQDLDYCDYMKVYLNQLSKVIPDDDSIIDWWDMVKLQIKSRSIYFSKCKIKRENKIINYLKHQFMDLEALGKYVEAQQIKDEVLELEVEKLKGYQIRSKSELIEEGEKPSKNFFRKEAYRAKRKIINRIVDKNGIERDSSDEILVAFKDYYTDLFSEEAVDKDVISDLLGSVPKIDSDEQDSLGDYIKLDEIRIASSAMLSEKSPGSDGLTKEFYCTFLDILGPILVRVYKVIYDKGFLSESQRLSYISLICKDASNSHLLKNYRPISLLNVDYKMLTKILCNRLKIVLGDVINEDQTCGVPGRSILNSAALIRDIIDFHDQRDGYGVLLSLDQEKAFDRVSHDYLFKVLEAFGMGNKFIKWIKTIYCGISSSVIVNHFISNPFSVTRSVRQGCSLSPLLYVLCLEPVLIKIRGDDKIKGFIMPGGGKVQKVTAFADDSNFTLQDNESVDRVVRWYDYYGKGSGAKLNKGKCKGMYMGKWKNKADHPFGISWVDKIKIFGIWFGNISVEEIWRPIFEKICFTLNLFKSRNLSMYGKAIIVNVMILSKLWYLASIIVVPETLIKALERLIFSFIWGRENWEPIKRSTLYLSKEQGGLGLVNIALKVISLHLVFVSKIIYNDNDYLWVPLADLWIGLQLVRFKDYLFSNTQPHCVDDLPIFYNLLVKNLHNLRKLDPSFTFERGRSANWYYKYLMEKTKVNPRVLSRFPQINFSLVFKNASHSKVDPSLKNVTFKLMHDVLPVAYQLSLYFTTPVDPFCFWCRIEHETVEHLFYYCPLVKPTRQYLDLWVREITGISLNLELVRFSFYKDLISKTAREALLILLGEYRAVVWNYRNRVRIDNVNPNYLVMQKMFLNKIKLRIRCDFYRLNVFSFSELWCFDSICNVQSGTLVFSF